MGMGASGEFRRPLMAVREGPSHDSPYSLKRIRENIRKFFTQFAPLLFPVVVPGAHVFVASNPLLSHLVFEPFVSAGFEKRG